MDFANSPKVEALCRAVTMFFDDHIRPSELAFERERGSHRDAGTPWTPSDLVESLKVKAREQGLWNLFMPQSARAPARLSNLEYAPLCENKAARREIAMIKVVAPNVTAQILDWAIQAHGAAGVSGDFPLARAYAGARSLRLADGPDEVHREAIARLELGRYTAERRASARESE